MYFCRKQLILMQKPRRSEIEYIIYVQKKYEMIAPAIDKVFTDIDTLIQFLEKLVTEAE